MASKNELQLYCTNLIGVFHIEYLNAYKILEDTNTQRYSSSVKKIHLILKCFFFVAIWMGLIIICCCINRI